MTQKPSPVNDSLSTLRAALEIMRRQNLPAQTQTAVKNALQALHQHTESLTEREEQKRLAALYRVSQTLGSTLRQDEVLQQVMDAVIDLTGASRGFVMMHNELTKELDLVQGLGVDQEKLNADDMKISHTVIDMVMGSGQGVVTTNAQEDPRFSTSGSVASFALRSILCAPLRRANQVFGVVYVDNRAHAGLFDDADLELLNAFAAQAAVAIDNARLYTQTDEKLAERVRELENLARINRELNRQPDMENVIQVAHKWAHDGSMADTAWLAVKQNDDDNAFMILSGERAGEQIHVHDPSVRGVVEAGTPHISAPSAGAPARIVVPLLVENETLGVISVESMAPFPSSTLQYLTRLANLTSVGLARAKLAEQIQQGVEEQAEFISVVAHELRLPMTSIRGYTDLLRQGAMGEINEQQQQFLDVIRKNVIRMNALVTGISDVSKIESGRIVLALDKLPLLSLVEEAVDDQKEILAEFEQTVDVQVAGDLPLAQLDASRFKQVLGYMIDNAAKYAPEGQVVTVSAEAQDGVIKIIIADQGYGITSDDQPHIFEQFFRSEDQRIRDRHGWGVGLTVCNGLIELMGGKIGFQSQPDKGTTFWITVPIASEEEEAEEAETPEA